MKLRILQIIFDTEIAAYEIPAFRGAVIKKVGQENSVLFHNHIDDTQYRYSYPLIQYKRIKRHPAIICIDQGVDEIHRFFEQSTWDLKIGDKIHNIKIHRLQVNQFAMNVWENKFHYRLYNWLALNQENYSIYRKTEGVANKIKFLEKKLTANILSFAKGIGWTIDKEIKLTIDTPPEVHTVTDKQNKQLAFNTEFSTNVFLPNYIGLGRRVSIGFGTLRNIEKTKR